MVFTIVNSTEFTFRKEKKNENGHLAQYDSFRSGGSQLVREGREVEDNCKVFCSMKSKKDNSLGSLFPRATQATDDCPTEYSPLACLLHVSLTVSLA